MEQRDFIRAGLEYVCLIQEVQERKKFEFVETVSKGFKMLFLNVGVQKRNSSIFSKIFQYLRSHL